jgi:hypothetical protein
LDLGARRLLGLDEVALGLGDPLDRLLRVVGGLDLVEVDVAGGVVGVVEVLA